METLMSRTYPLYEVLLRAGDEARGLLAANKAQRQEGLQAVAGVLADKPGFTRELDAPRAADVLYGLVSEEHYGLVVAERGWAPWAWRDWVSAVLTASFYPSTSA
jgi:hypothetical protein